MNLLDKANSFTIIYQDMLAYKNLRAGDQEFFDALFLPLLVYGDLTWSNEEIAENLKEEGTDPIPISTVEKRLRVLRKQSLSLDGIRDTRIKRMASGSQQNVI